MVLLFMLLLTRARVGLRVSMLFSFETKFFLHEVLHDHSIMNDDMLTEQDSLMKGHVEKYMRNWNTFVVFVFSNHFNLGNDPIHPPFMLNDV